MKRHENTEKVIEDGGHGATVIKDGQERATDINGWLPGEATYIQGSRYAWIEQRSDDLNLLRIANHDGRARSLDMKPVSQGGITVYFRDLEHYLIEHIRKADAVIGCIAWLTNKDILDALAEKDPVAIVVQKEDFLRPDLKGGRGWPAELRRRYDRITCSWDRYDLPVSVGSLSSLGDPSIQSVRCVGNYNRDKHPAFPRMHHKFIVLCRKGQETDRWKWQDADGKIRTESRTHPALKPYAVWTGSLNFTENGSRSLENAVLIEKQRIVDAYVDEWSRITALSEPLDWDADWVAPEWRLGT